MTRSPIETSPTRSESPPDRAGAVIRLSSRVAWLVHRLAIIVGAAAVVALAVGARYDMVPSNPEGGMLASIDGPLQVGLLGLVASGLVLAVRWPAPGAVIVLLGGVALTVLASMQHPPGVAIVIAVVFAVPAVALWIAWQRRERWPSVIGLAVVSALLLGGAWTGADRIYNHYFGPTHPASATPPLEDPDIAWAWSGGVTSEGFRVVAEVAGDGVVTGMEVEGPGGERDLVAVGPVSAPARAHFAVEGLTASTSYTYRFVLADGTRSRWEGVVETAPGPGDDGEVVLAFSSCARTGSNGQVFDAIRATEPDLFVIGGDFHYESIGGDDVDAFDRAYDSVLTSPAQAALYRSAPIAYVWDDHDYSTNDGDATAASRPAARASYESHVPHYDLVDDTTINQAFSIGSVRVVMVDTRSAQRPGSTLLGADQFAWLVDELVTSAPTHRLVVMVTPTPWIGEASAGSDAWAGFAAEREALANEIARNRIDNLLIVGGDAHMLAIDDGTNSDYSTSGSAAVPVLQAAALDRPGSEKGGPYSEGTHPGGGQFGLVTVSTDDRGNTIVDLAGRRHDGTTVVAHSFVVSPPEVAGPTDR